MTETKTETEYYECSKMGKEVKITYEINLHRSCGVGEIDKETIFEMGCDHSSDCGVKKSSGDYINVNWAKCVHPTLSR